MNGVGRVADRLRNAGSAVALTGAGLSTASGLPDFRGPSGLWESFDPSEFSLATFEADPGEFWTRWEAMDEAVREIDPEPNPGHRALADLLQGEMLDAILTQNADGLHQAAGAATGSVVELHGSIKQSRCPTCSWTEPIEDSLDRFDGADAPRCQDCTTPMKPDVVLFGEPLPTEGLRRARLLTARCDLMLVVGTSLTVEPAASLPTLALETGGSVVVNNDEETHIDGRAEVRIGEPAEQVLPALRDRLVDGG